MGGVLPVAAGEHRHLVRHHEGGVEAHAELADDVGLVLVPLQLRLELQGAAFGDGAQVLLQLGGGHADAVIGDGEGAGGFVRGDGDAQVGTLHLHRVIGEGEVGQLVDGVAGVGDDLPEEDLLVGVDGVDHQVHQAFGFRFELFFCHG